MLYRADDSFRGFLSFNEGFYTDIATQYANMPLYRVITAPLDLNNPPLYLLLLTIAFKVFGVGVFVARSLSIVFSLASVYFLYKLGKHFYGSVAGLMAALLFALNPALQLVGRNIQPEALFLFLVLSSIYFYLLSVEQENARMAVISGILLGLGILTKLPAVLVLMGIVVWHLAAKQKQLLIDRRFYQFSATALVVGTSWFIYQAASRAIYFLIRKDVLPELLLFPIFIFLKISF